MEDVLAQIQVADQATEVSRNSSTAGDGARPITTHIWYKVPIGFNAAGLVTPPPSFRALHGMGFDDSAEPLRYVVTFEGPESANRCELIVYWLADPARYPLTPRVDVGSEDKLLALDVTCNGP